MARVDAVYLQRAALFPNTDPSSNTTTLCHCEPCALWHVIE
jgi:hypothetical protein